MYVIAERMQVGLLIGTCLSWEGNEQMKPLDVRIRYAKYASFLANWGFSGQSKM